MKSLHWSMTPLMLFSSSLQTSLRYHKVDRLDWVTSSGAIQQQIWQKIIEADLVICDLTDYNPNVMVEGGGAGDLYQGPRMHHAGAV